MNVPFLLPLTKYPLSFSADRPPPDHSCPVSKRNIAVRPSVREGIALAPKVGELSQFSLRLRDHKLSS